MFDRLVSLRSVAANDRDRNFNDYCCGRGLNRKRNVCARKSIFFGVPGKTSTTAAVYCVRVGDINQV